MKKLFCWLFGHDFDEGEPVPHVKDLYIWRCLRCGSHGTYEPSGQGE